MEQANDETTTRFAILLLTTLGWIETHFHHYDEPNALRGLMFLIAIPTIYFLPSLIAWVRYHHAHTAVFVLNLFLGWTFLGWVGALVWAVMPVQERTLTSTEREFIQRNIADELHC